MAHEPLLDLERMHVLAAGDDHVVDAADEIEVAVGVELPEIAWEVPAVPDLPRVGVGPIIPAVARYVLSFRGGAPGRRWGMSPQHRGGRSADRRWCVATHPVAALRLGLSLQRKGTAGP